jgi:hypothetical protein
MIKSFTYGTFVSYGGNNGACGSAPCVSGDSYNNTWADDDVIYVTLNDTPNGWDAVGASANMSFNSLNGYTSSLVGTQVNAMAAWGTQAQVGADNADFKAGGLISISGTLYLWVWRQQQAGTGGPVLSSQLIKSSNHGTTWTPVPTSPTTPYASPMFTSRFSIPQFVQYGKDYTGNTVDLASTYVYAISPDKSHVPSGLTYSDQMIIGRVALSNISALNAADWTFYLGGDGTNSANWGTEANAVPILLTPGFRQFYNPSVIVYLPQWGNYLMGTHSSLSDSALTPTVWHEWAAVHPWGPWKEVQGSVWGAGNPQDGATGFYSQSPIVKGIQANNTSFNTISTGDIYLSNAWYTMYFTPTTVAGW